MVAGRRSSPQSVLPKPGETWCHEGMVVRHASDDARVLDGFGERLRRLRTERGLTLAELAASTGMSTSTMSRLENDQRRPTLEALLAIARAHRVSLDDLVGVPDEVDPRIRLDARRVRGRTVVPLSRTIGVQAWKIGIPARAEKPDLRRHDGSEWLYVLNGELRLILGSQDLVLHAGEAAQFDTQRPHWFGGTGRSRAEILSLFNRAGAHVHVQTMD